MAGRWATLGIALVIVSVITLAAGGAFGSSATLSSPSPSLARWVRTVEQPGIRRITYAERTCDKVVAMWKIGKFKSMDPDRSFHIMVKCPTRVTAMYGVAGRSEAPERRLDIAWADYFLTAGARMNYEFLLASATRASARRSLEELLPGTELTERRLLDEVRWGVAGGWLPYDRVTNWDPTDGCCLRFFCVLCNFPNVSVRGEVKR